MVAGSKPRVLFLCTGNSCRSQMAEGWLRHLAGERFEVLSAGIETHGLNPAAVRAMAEVGVDIAGQRSEPVERWLDPVPEVVVTVCDHAADHAPSFPPTTRLLHWPFPDPAGASGDEGEVRNTFARVRDAIRARIEDWLTSGAEPPCASAS